MDEMERRAGPIIWPIIKTNNTKKISYNNNLDNDRHFQRETTITLVRILSAPPVNSEGEGSHIINLAYIKNK